MSKLQDCIGKKFTITTEIKPPVGPDTSGFLEEAKKIVALKRITAVNVIDSPSARLFMSSLGASIMLKQNGIEPIFQMVCRDRNILALESDLLSASAFGITNILSLTGDHPGRGASDHPFIKPVYDLDSTSLLATISKMNGGISLSGKELNAKTSFFPGAAITPTSKPKEPEILKIKRKIDAGARFFQTQAVFDPQTIDAFFTQMDEYVGDIRKNILVGLIPLASDKMIRFLNGLPGIEISEDVENRIKNSKDQVEEAVTLGCELIDEIKKQGLGGVHIMPVGRISLMEKIIESI